MHIKKTLKNKFAEMLADAMQSTFAQVAEELVNELSGLSLRDLVELTDADGDERPVRKAGVSGAKRASVSGAKRASSSARLPRRSAEDIDAAADKLASILGRKKNGMRAEEIRSALGMDVRELPRVIKAALATKKIVVLSGQKRSTTYGLRVTGAKAAKPAEKSARKTKSAKPIETNSAPVFDET